MEYLVLGKTKGTSGLGHWKPNKPMNIKPVITGTVEEEGTTFYVDGEGKRYNSVAFNRMWGAPVQKVEKKKGKAKV